MSRRVKVEICVEDIASAIAAGAGGADRVELCDSLAVGGTTPSAGAIAESCRRLSIPVHVLIRPRGGDFIYSEPEIVVMMRDIEMAKSLGSAGVVLGVLAAGAVIDRDQTEALIAMARPLSVTFHKAFDKVVDPLKALEILIDLGVDRVLTSGGRPTALEGVAILAHLVDLARDRIVIMAGGRLTIDNLETVIQHSHVSEVHLGSAASRKVATPMGSTPEDGSNTSWRQTEPSCVAAIIAKVGGLSHPASSK